MREKIARAIALDQDGMEDWWEAYSRTADAVLEALHEPTEAMEEAGAEASRHGNMRQIWFAMIAAARDGA